MNIPLAGKRVPVLAERHRNMPDAALNRPQARNIGKEGSLHIKEFSHFLYRQNGIVKVRSQLLQLRSLFQRAFRDLVHIE